MLQYLRKPTALFAVGLVVMTGAVTTTSAAAAATEPAYPPPNIESQPLDATSLRLVWWYSDEDHQAVDNADSFTIRMRKGTEPPSSSATPLATVQDNGNGGSYDVHGLIEGAAYTFSVVAHNSAGDSTPVTITDAARRRGDFVMPPTPGAKVPKTYEGIPFALTALPHGATAVAYLSSVKLPNTSELRTFYRRRDAHGHWSQPYQVGHDNPWLQRVHIASHAHRTVVEWAGYRNGPEFRIRNDRTGAWSGLTTLPFKTGLADVEGIAIDGDHAVHVLVRKDATGAPLHYLVRRNGHWHDSVVPGARCDREPATSGSILDPDCAAAVLSLDSVRDRILIAERHVIDQTVDGSTGKCGLVSVASVPAKWNTLTRMHPVICRSQTGVRLLPSAIASHGGQITLGLRGFTASQPNPRGPVVDSAPGGLYLMTGSTIGRLGHLTKIPNTTVDDDDRLLAKSVGENQVALGWWSDSRWDRSTEGVWTQRRSYDPTNRTWQFAEAKHRTANPYDVLWSLSVIQRRVMLGYSR